MTLPPDVEGALRRHGDELVRAAAALSAAEALYREHRQAAEAATEDAVRALAAALVPSLDDPASLALAAQALQLPALSPEAAAQERAARKDALERRIAAVVADARFSGARERLALLDERSRELLEPVAHLRESVRTLAQDEDFREVLQHGDDGRWWTFSCHRARAAGERALERHGKRRRVSSTSELVKKHREERAALETLEAELASLGAERQGLRALLDEHAEASALLGAVEGTLLDELRASVASALRYLEDTALLSALRDPPLRALARRVSGCRARVRYLEGVFLHHVERTRGALASHQQDVALLHTPGTFTRRPPPASPQEVERETRRWTREVDEKVRLYRSTAERLLAFTRWAEHDPLAGALWWDAFTGGALDGSFLDEVAWHRTMGRPRGPTLQHGRVDAREGWARNALHAMEALAEAQAELLASRGEADVAADEATGAAAEGAGTAPEPVALPDDDG